MRYSYRELDGIIERLDKMDYNLTEWERCFLRSVRTRREKAQPLTNKQQNWLSKIWDRLQEDYYARIS